MTPTLRIALALLLATACARQPDPAPAPPDPIALLKTGEPSPYNLTFWSREERDHTLTWARATEVCRDATTSNCMPVRQIASLAAAAQQPFPDEAPRP